MSHVLLYEAPHYVREKRLAIKRKKKKIAAVDPDLLERDPLQLESIIESERNPSIT